MEIVQCTPNRTQCSEPDFVLKIVVSVVVIVAPCIGRRRHRRRCHSICRRARLGIPPFYLTKALVQLLQATTGESTRNHQRTPQKPLTCRRDNGRPAGSGGERRVGACARSALGESGALNHLGVMGSSRVVASLLAPAAAVAAEGPIGGRDDSELRPLPRLGFETGGSCPNALLRERPLPFGADSPAPAPLSPSEARSPSPSRRLVC